MKQDIEEAKLQLLREEVEAKKQFLEDMAATERPKLEMLEGLVEHTVRD